jgi:Galactose oxidase, central domain
MRRQFLPIVLTLVKEPFPLSELLLFLLLFSYASTVAAQSPGTFTATGDMTTARVGHTATLLLDGRVLIVGGDKTGTAELYDPATGTFSPTGNGTTGHGGDASWGEPSTAALLPDGRVLIAGGRKSEIYDPVIGSFTATGNMVSNQRGFTATALTNGKVLITGGTNGETNCCAIAAHPELYDPSTGTFNLTGPYAEMSVPSFANGYSAGTSGLTYTAATLLSDGKVLILSEPAAEIYDPVTDSFSLTGSMVAVDEGGFWGKPTQISARTATLMTNEKVLIAGGEPAYYDTGDFPLSRAELYDASTGTFTATSSMHAARSGHAATLLPDGTVLITGGRVNNFYSATSLAELYSPSSGTFSGELNMTVSRGYHQATRLRDGRVLITGGLNSGSNSYPGYQTLASAELYTPAVLVPDEVVTDLQFDRTSVVAGSSFSANFSGTNLTPQTFFDVRFTSPGSNTSDVVLNWQRGLTVSHDVSAVTVAGSYTINGVRAHEVESDHTSNFVPVKATITVSPSVLVPPPVVTDLRFDRTSVVVGSSFSAIFSGSNLSAQSFFDVRFSAPGSNTSAVVLNWQRGTALSHDVSADTAPGNWTIDGVRPHEIETDQTGMFFPVSATIIVSR